VLIHQVFELVHTILPAVKEG